MAKNIWKDLDKKEVFSFCDGYIKYLDNSKTERLCESYSKMLSEKEGFKDISEYDTLKAGDKVYFVNRDKSIAFFVIGEEDIEKGINIIASHIDSPRLDLKPNPLYEDMGIGLLKTHYYGGIKKYQWTTIPMSLIGVVIKENGEKININIGEDDNDPVFTITDLLPHLAKDQMAKKAGEVVEGESLNALFGSIATDEEKDSVKNALLEIIKEKYGFTEDDFISSELELVPNSKARNVGLDMSMIGSYGQDDRVCAYTSLAALLDIKNPKKTCMCFLADKEEIGSMGVTGTKSRFFENAIAEVIAKMKPQYNDLMLRKTLSASVCLSADVSAANDPNYKSVCEDKNAAYLGGGLCLVKYTGARGKSSTSDANAEIVARVRGIFNSNNVLWQMAELGKVDQGGGGTVAQYIANLDIDTIDCGVPLFSMHAPFEIASKADVYMAYKGYRAFYEAE